MLGDEILGTCRVINHDARDDSSLVDLGESGNCVPTRLCRHWLEADLPNHDRLRRAALLRRVLGRAEDGGTRPCWSGHGAHAARRHARRRPALDLGDHRREPDARRHPRDRGAARGKAALQHGRPARPAAADHARLRGRALRDARPGLCGREADRHARDQPPVRSRGDDELGLPARPEPVPGGQGDVGCGAGGQGRRHDPLRGGVQRRHSGPRPLRRATRTRRLAGGTASADRGPARDRAGPVAGPGPGADPAPRPGAGQGGRPERRGSLPPPTSSRRRTSMPRSPSAWRAAQPYAFACCRRVRRRFRTWRPSRSVAAASRRGLQAACGGGSRRGRRRTGVGRSRWTKKGPLRCRRGP